MGREPFSLLSLAAKELFKEQLHCFKALPAHTREIVALRLVDTFRKEADELSTELYNLEYKYRESLKRKTGWICDLLTRIILGWINKVKWARDDLMALQKLIVTRKWVRPNDFCCLANFRECSHWIRESIPLFIREAQYTDRHALLLSRFALYRYDRSPFSPESELV